jgi:hypothetical protein
VTTPALPDPPSTSTPLYELNYFHPPVHPNGGTVHRHPVTPVDWFRTAPVGGGTVFQQPTDTTGETR